VLNSVVACNELIQRKIYDLPILSLKALIAALPNYDLSACIWNEVAWSRLIINLMYQEAQRRRFQPQDWYYLLDQNQKGPISRAELEVLLANKNQSIEWIWRDGFDKWMHQRDWPNFIEPIQKINCKQISKKETFKKQSQNQQNTGVTVVSGIFQFIEFPFWIGLFFFALFTSYNSFTGLLLPVVFCIFMIFLSIPLGVGLLARRTWAWNLKVVTAMLTILWFLNMYWIDGRGAAWVVAAVLEGIILTLVLLAKPSLSTYE
jgi:hypothetical protein